MHASERQWAPCLSCNKNTERQHLEHRPRLVKQENRLHLQEIMVKKGTTVARERCTYVGPCTEHGTPGGSLCFALFWYISWFPQSPLLFASGVYDRQHRATTQPRLQTNRRAAQCWVRMSDSSSVGQSKRQSMFIIRTLLEQRSCTLKPNQPSIPCLPAAHSPPCAFHFASFVYVLPPVWELWALCVVACCHELWCGVVCGVVWCGVVVKGGGGDTLGWCRGGGGVGGMWFWLLW